MGNETYIRLVKNQTGSHLTLSIHITRCFIGVEENNIILLRYILLKHHLSFSRVLLLNLYSYFVILFITWKTFTGPVIHLR